MGRSIRLYTSLQFVKRNVFLHDIDAWCILVLMSIQTQIANIISWTASLCRQFMVKQYAPVAIYSVRSNPRQR
jgi:hypothetical protein